MLHELCKKLNVSTSAFSSDVQWYVNLMFRSLSVSLPSSSMDIFVLKFKVHPDSAFFFTVVIAWLLYALPGLWACRCAMSLSHESPGQNSIDFQ